MVNKRRNNIFSIEIIICIGMYTRALRNDLLLLMLFCLSEHWTLAAFHGRLTKNVFFLSCFTIDRICLALACNEYDTDSCCMRIHSVANVSDRNVSCHLESVSVYVCTTGRCIVTQCGCCGCGRSFTIVQRHLASVDCF